MTIRYEKLSEKVVEKIITMIKEGELKVGDKLSNELELSKELGISRGILREALNILQEKGYISRKTGVGTYISSPKVKEQLEHSIRTAPYLDLLIARDAVEQKIIELVIKNATDEEIERLGREIFDKKSAEYKEENNFHLKLAELSQNKILENFIKIYIGMIKEIGEKSYGIKGRYLAVEHEHEELYGVIKKRDLPTARELLRAHLNTIKEIIEKQNIF